MFLAYSGAMRWRTSAGDEMAASLGEPLTKDLIAQAWRTALNPKGEWIPSVLAAANKRLTELRRGVPDAGGMVIATDQETARAYAGTLKEITGESATIVLSDDAGASDRIEEYAAGTQRWMVAVRMVSEGVDVPRSRSGSTPRPPPPRCSSPRPSVASCGSGVAVRPPPSSCQRAHLLDLASQLEIERDHALDKPKKDEDEAGRPRTP